MTPACSPSSTCPLASLPSPHSLSSRFPQHQIDALRVKRDVLGPLVAAGRKKQVEQESRRDDSTDEEQEKEGAEKMPGAVQRRMGMEEGGGREAGN